MHIALRLSLGAIVGAVLGYAYYKFIGCSTGACPITANPYSSIIFGAITGLVISNG